MCKENFERVISEIEVVFTQLSYLSFKTGRSWISQLLFTSELDKYHAFFNTAIDHILIIDSIINEFNRRFEQNDSLEDDEQNDSLEDDEQNDSLEQYVIKFSAMVDEIKRYTERFSRFVYFSDDGIRDEIGHRVNMAHAEVNRAIAVMNCINRENLDFGKGENNNENDQGSEKAKSLIKSISDYFVELRYGLMSILFHHTGNQNASYTSL